MEEDHGGDHTDNETHTDHRISDTEGERLHDIHPQQRGYKETESAGGKLPIEKYTRPERAVPTEGGHPHQGELQQHLTAGQEKALQNG